MGVVGGFKGAGLFAKVALVLLVISTMFVWIAFTCTGWGEETSNNAAFTSGRNHFGLWRFCGSNEVTPNCIPTDGWANDWFAACQALVTFGFFGINVALFLLILYMFVPSCQKNGEIAMATAIVCIVTDWYAATQALVTFGFFGINVALVLLILYMFVPKFQKNGEIAMATAIICIVTGILYLIGVIVYGAKFKEDFIDPNPSGDYILSYCFGLSVVALLLEIAAGVLTILDSKKEILIASL